MKLHSKILVGLLVGLTAGILTNQIVGADGPDNSALNFVISNLTDPVGQIFLRLLFMIVVPLVFASLSLGVLHLGDLRSLGRIGLKTLGYFLVVTAIAVIVGVLLIQIVQPGTHFDPDLQDRLLAQYGSSSSEVIGRSRTIALSVMTFVDMVLPRNMLKAFVEMQMLPVIFASLLFGIVLARLPETVSGSLSRGLTGLYEFSVRIVDLAMRMAPVAVPCLVFGIAARFGFSILKPLGLFVALVFLGYVIHTVGVYSVLLKTTAGTSPWKFFVAVKSVMITAFSTSSSNATLPTTLKVTEENLGIPSNIAGFVIPLGATINMNGTALYEGMTVLFLAEIFGIELSLLQQALVVVMCVLTAIGTAGIPGGSLPMVVLVMQSVGVPAEGIGIILGIDRLLDMGRTVVNVTGDMAAAAFVANTEGHPVRYRASDL